MNDKTTTHLPRTMGRLYIYLHWSIGGIQVVGPLAQKANFDHLEDINRA